MDSDSGNQFPAGNQPFQQAYQPFPNQQYSNAPMMLSQVQSFPQQGHNMMTPFVQQQPLMHLNPQSDQMVQIQQNGMPFNGVPQFSPQMMPNQTQLSGQNPQFRPAGSDWRTNLSATDRHHVIGQLGRAVQQALPPSYHTPDRVDNLARSVEQHIYETADSRANYLSKIKEQLTNIQRKGTVLLMLVAMQIRNGQFPDPGMQGLQPSSPAVGNPGNIVSGSPNLQQNSPSFLMQGGNQPNQNQAQAKSKLSNDTSAEITQANNSTDSMFNQNPFGFDLDIMSNENSQSSANSMNINPTQSQSNNPSFTQSGLKQSVQPQTPAQTPPSLPTSPTKGNTAQNGNPEPNAANSEANAEISESNGGQQHEVPTVIGGSYQFTLGMKVTLLNLTDAEKHSVSAKMEQIRPTYMRIDGLISTLLKQGGEKEFDKVRKLTGMKQMLGAQLEVLDQDIFFIRPDTLQALLPSLQQYFHYAELLVNRAGGQNASLQANAANPRPPNANANFSNMQIPGMGSPVVNNSLMGQPAMNAQNRSPMVAQNQMNMVASPNVRPGMMVSPQVRPNIPPGQGRGMVNQQPMHTRIQHIQLLNAKNQQLSSQLQQIQQLMQSQGIPQEQMQSLNQKQQECLRQQQQIQQQLMSLNSSQMPHPNFNRAPMRPLRPDANGNMSPDMRMQMQPGQQINPQMYQSQMMGVNPQMMNMQNPQFNQFQFQARPQNAGMMMQQQQALQQMQMQNAQMGADQSMFMQRQVGQASPQMGKNALQAQAKTSPVVNPNTTMAKPTKGKKEPTPKIPPNTPKISTPNMPQGIPPQNIQGSMSDVQGMQQAIPMQQHAMQGMQQQNQMQGMPQNMLQQQVNMQGMQNQGLQPGMNGMPGTQAMQAAANLQQQVMMNKMQSQTNSPMNQPAAMMQMRPGIPANMTPMQQQAMAQMNQRNQLNNAQRNQFNGMPNQGQPNMQMNMQNPSFQQGQQGYPARIQQQQDARSPQTTQFNAPLNPAAPRPPAPAQTASSDDWFNDFPSMPETKKEEPTETGTGYLILGDPFDQDFFNFDYVPPSSQKSLKLENENLDELLESHVNETSNSNKRQRDEFDDFFQDSEKKPKFHSSLESELKSISTEHNLTYTLNNTPNDTASIKFTYKNTSFQITVKNKSIYEKGSGKGLISFATTQSPDSLSKLVSEYVSPNSSKRVSDIVQVIVSALEK
ncbi:hypothetical protein HDV01_001595 [Terramyces sp. JEL0728]|nr:hypothetical protein HDV01_001595 [Terramyces sp. JEL0728]